MCQASFTLLDYLSAGAKGALVILMLYCAVVIGYYLPRVWKWANR